MAETQKHGPRQDMVVWGGAVLIGVTAGLLVGFTTGRPVIHVNPTPVQERFRTTATHGETDSLAVYRTESQSLLLATDKHGHHLQIFDAANGKFLREFGSQGKNAGQFERPNGVAVWQPDVVGGDLSPMLFVVERDGKRVQTFSLPELTPLCEFGHDVLTKPYGVAVLTSKAGKPIVFVTDNSSGMGERVRRYDWHGDGGKAAFTCTRAFGATSSEGSLRIVESIAADPYYHCLYICDEHRRGRNVKVYSEDGEFLNKTFGEGYITDDPEGIALWQDGRNGWIVVTNQGKKQSTFHVFDRASLRWVGAFVGNPVIANTDGIALSAGTVGSLNGGGFFAVDDDGVIAAYSLTDIEQTLALRQRLPLASQPAPKSNVLDH